MLKRACRTQSRRRRSNTMTQAMRSSGWKEPTKPARQPNRRNMVAGMQLGCRRARLSARSLATQRHPEARSPTQTCQPSWPGCSRNVRTCAAAWRSRRPRLTSGWRNTCKRPLNVSSTSRSSCVLRQIVSRLAFALARTDCESLGSQRPSARSVQELEQRALQAEARDQLAPHALLLDQEHAPRRQRLGLLLHPLDLTCHDRDLISPHEISSSR